MAHLVRPWKTYHADAAGRRVPKSTPGAQKVKARAAKWYAAGVPGWPKGRRVPLATDKRVARKMLEDLVARAERGAAGLADLKPLARPLAEYLAAFEAKLRNAGNSDKHVGQTLSRVRKVVHGCGFKTPGEIAAAKVERFVAALRAAASGPGGRPDVGAKTGNYYLREVKAFCRYLVDEDVLPRNPLAKSRGVNADADLRHARRSLTRDELVALLAAAGCDPGHFRGLTGRDRQVLYLTALGTGFRSGELAVLTPSRFALDADPPHVTLARRESKNRKGGVQPLPAELAAVLRDYLAGREAGSPVWPGTWREKAAKMLKRDLAAAGIPYVVESPDGPLHADFHALRHTFVAELERSGVSLKRASELARHSDIKLTAKVYGRATLAELAASVRGLALLPAPDVQDAEVVAAVPPPTPADLAALALLGWGAFAAVTGIPAAAVAPRVAPDPDSDGDGRGREGTGAAVGGAAGAAQPPVNETTWHTAGRAGTGGVLRESTPVADF